MCHQKKKVWRTKQLPLLHPKQGTFTSVPVKRGHSHLHQNTAGKTIIPHWTLGIPVDVCGEQHVLAENAVSQALLCHYWEVIVSLCLFSWAPLQWRGTQLTALGTVATQVSRSEQISTAGQCGLCVPRSSWDIGKGWNHLKKYPGQPVLRCSTCQEAAR